MITDTMNQQPDFTAWVTEYALTIGIRKIQARIFEREPLLLWVLGVETKYVRTYFSGEGRDWHRTEAAAIERAEVMRTAKIAALEKQLARLKALSFGGAGHG